MRNRLFAAGVLAIAVWSGSASAQGGDQAQRQGGSRSDQSTRRGGPPVNPAELERRVREEISEQLKRALQLPDGEHNRLMTLSFRFRDSTLMLRDRERFINRELNLASNTAGARAASDQRIACLIDAFWDVQLARVNMRKAEDRAVAQFLTPAKRLSYLSIQERLHELMDDFLQNQLDRRGGPGGARGGGSGRSSQGARGGAQPPSGGRPGSPGRTGGGPGAMIQTLCPPVPR